MKTKTIINIASLCLLMLAVFACASGGHEISTAARTGVRGLEVEPEDDTSIEVFPQLGHFSKDIYSVCFSPDGKQALSSSSSISKLWDLTTGMEIRTIVHNQSVYSSRFSPDGTQLIFYGELRNTATGREILDFSINGNRPRTIDFSPDGRLLLAGYSDRTIRLWDNTTGLEIKAFLSRRDIDSVKISPDGEHFLLLNPSQNIVELWDVARGRIIKTFRSYKYLMEVCFSPDGKKVLSGDVIDGIIELWDANTGRRIRTISRDKKSIYTLSFSPDGKQVFCGFTVLGENRMSYDYFAKLWDVETGREIRTFSDISDKDNQFYMLSPSGNQMLSVSNVIIPAGSPPRVGINKFTLWDVGTGQRIHTFSGHINHVYHICFSPDGKQILSGSVDGSVKLWDTVTGREILNLGSTIGSINSVSFSLDGKYVLSGSSNFSVKMWDTTTGRQIRTFSGHSNSVTSVCFSPNGNQVLSASYDNTIKLWDTATGRIASKRI